MARTIETTRNDEVGIVGVDSDASVSTQAKLDALERLDYAALRDEWRRLYRSPPPRITRDLLLLGVAWKIQEQAHGGFDAATKRQLADLAKTLERDGDLSASRSARIKPGAKLVREWGGRTYTVTVVDDGYDWNGRRWRSLSVIAREITGTQWSGPRFFGLNGKRSGAGDARSRETSNG